MYPSTPSSSLLTKRKFISKSVKIAKIAFILSHFHWSKATHSAFYVQRKFLSVKGFALMSLSNMKLFPKKWNQKSTASAMIFHVKWRRDSILNVRENVRKKNFQMFNVDSVGPPKKSICTVWTSPKLGSLFFREIQKNRLWKIREMSLCAPDTSRIFETFRRTLCIRMPSMYVFLKKVFDICCSPP